VIIVRWADDFVVGFQYEDDGRCFLEELRERSQRFSLELHPEKTRLIRFGRFAHRDSRRFDGRRKPETFNFLRIRAGAARKGGPYRSQDDRPTKVNRVTCRCTV